jgi:hypothetical protein
VLFRFIFPVPFNFFRPDHATLLSTTLMYFIQLHLSTVIIHLLRESRKSSHRVYSHECQTHANACTIYLQYINLQDEQCTYNVTLSRLCVTVGNRN